MRRLIVFVINFWAVVLPFIWTAQTSELFEIPKMMFTYAIAVTVLTAWALKSLADKKISLKRTPFDLPILLFLGSQVLSTLLSIDYHTSLFGYYSRMNGGLLSILSYILLYYAFINNFTAKEAFRFLGSLLFAALGASLYAFPEHFGASPSCLIIRGDWRADCWVQDVVTRVFGTFGQPNWLAAYLIMLIPLPLALFLTQKTLPKKMLHLGLFAVFTTVLIYTKSRSGLLGLGLGLSLFFVLNALATPKKITKLAGLAAGSALFLGLLITTAGRQIVPQIEQLLSSSAPPAPVTITTPIVGTQLETGGTESGDIRKIVWQGALDLFGRYPLWGSGVETFGYAYYNVRPVAHNFVSEWDFLYNKAHNEFLNYLSTTGLFGFGTYLWIMLAYSIWTLKIIRRSETKSKFPYQAALLSGFWALAVSNFFGFSTVAVASLFFLFPAVAVALNNPDSLPDSAIRYKGGELLIAGIILGGSAYLYWQVITLYRADTAFAAGKGHADQNELAPAISSLEKALLLRPNEPLYSDEMSYVLGEAAVKIYEEERDATGAADLGNLAMGLSDRTIRLNKVHLNFYKTRTRLFSLLGTLNPKYFNYSAESLKKAIELAPTDPKLYLNLALLKQQLEQPSEAEVLFKKAIELKPDYEQAHLHLAKYYQAEKQPEKALAQYELLLTINPKNPEATTAVVELRQSNRK